MDSDLDVPLQHLVGNAPPGMGLPLQPNNDLNDEEGSSEIPAAPGVAEQLEEAMNRIAQLEQIVLA